MRKQPYTSEQKQFLLDNCSAYTKIELADKFNAEFKDNRSPKAIQDAVAALGGRCKYCDVQRRTCFTSDMKAFIFKYAEHVSRAELKRLFDTQFHTDICLSTLKSFCVRHGLKSPNGDGQYTSETSPRWQAGLSKEEFKAHYTEQSFQHMVSPMIEKNKTHAVGDIIVRHKKLYIYVNANYGEGVDARLQEYDRYVWEQAYGKIPSGHILVHLDGDSMNCQLSNLICISSKFRAFFRHNNWWSACAEVKSAAVAWCKLYYALKDNNIK